MKHGQIEDRGVVGSVRFPESIWKGINTMAQREGKTRSQLIRDLVYECLSKGEETELGMRKRPLS